MNRSTGESQGGIGICPCLRGEGIIRCVSLEGLGVPVQKVVPDFARLLIARGSHIEGASWDE